MTDYVQVKCRHCEKSTQISLEAIKSEIQRLRTYNYEILACQHCIRKFSKEDFEKAIGIGRLEEISKQLNCSTEELPAQLASQLPDLTNEQIITVIEKEKELQQKKEEELKKMQAGEPYDEKLVGHVDMEEGTPQDKRCVKILKKEGELYAYTFNAIDYVVTNVWEFIRTICHAIWDIIKKINWCIVCSVLRIGYFIGYIGMIIYSIIATFILNEAVFHNNYKEYITANSITTPSWAWTLLVLLICALPLVLQIGWAFGTPSSRWAKVIKKRADEIIK